jgi:FADH2 O2-dependent halogenase
MQRDASSSYDVIILGSGMAGTILGAILGRAGKRVLILDAKEHPRFAIGESTIPQTSQLLTLLAKEHDVPELSSLGLDAPKGLRREIGNCCGIKRTFGFAYHDLDREHDPRQANQFGNVWRDENHLFRQDVDAFLVRVALRHGCEVRQRIRVSAIEVGPSGATVATDRLGTLSTRFVVDGSGYKSLLADRFGLRDEPPRMLHHSRSLFNHMIDVEPFEDCVTNELHVKWSQGTLHHVFDHGWVWVIPFNNWEGSTNPLVSIGLTLDPRVYPEPEGVSPEDEFAAFMERLPSANRQFTRAKAVREWVRTGRLQYSASRTIGPRFCLLSHAAGFVDALFSRGLINTMEVIRGLAPLLLAALDDDDFDESRFEALDARQLAVLDYADRLAFGSFAAWRDFEVWNVWMRVWAIGTGVAESNLGSYVMAPRHSEWRPLPNPIFSDFEHPGYRDYFERSFAIIDRYDRREIDAATATRELGEVLSGYCFEMPLPERVAGHEWALRNPRCRDFLLGSPDLHERWNRNLPDPHLG